MSEQRADIATRFQVGHLAPLKHGAQSDRIVTANLPAAVAEVRDALAEALTYCEPPDGLLIEQLARLLVRIRLVDEYYDRLGGSMVDVQGRPRRSWQLYVRLLSEFRATAAALGIGPVARGQLMADLAGARRDRQAADSQRELQERYGKKEATG